MQPKIDVPAERIDHFLELSAWICILLLVIIPAYSYSALPDLIPTHYGPDGNADAFGNKYTIFLLPAIGLVLYFGLKYLITIPHRFNYISTITSTNAQQQYRKAQRVIRYLNVVIPASFAFITHRTILTAQNSGLGLGTYFLPIFMIATLGGCLFLILESDRG